MATSLIGSYSDLQACDIALQSLLVSVCSNPVDTANALLENDFEWIQAADAANATAVTAELAIGWVPRRAMCVSANYTPSTTTGLTASATLYATLTVQSRAGNTTGGTNLILAQAISTLATSGGTGNWAQWVPVPFAVNAFDPNNAVIPAGGIITYKSAVASTGTIIPGGMLQVRVRYV